jgi:hypothetical protein
MKKYYTLVDTFHRNSINLLTYNSDITNSVHVANSSIKVIVFKSYYVLLGYITKDDLYAIGKNIGQTSLGAYAKTYYYKSKGKTKKSTQIFKCYKTEELN